MITSHRLFSLISRLKIWGKTPQVRFLLRINLEQHRKLIKWVRLVSRLGTFLRLTTGHLKSLSIFNRPNKIGNLHKQSDLIWLKTLKSPPYSEKWLSLPLLMKSLLPDLLWWSFRLLYRRRLINRWRMLIRLAMHLIEKEKWNLGHLLRAVPLLNFHNWKIKELLKDKRHQSYHSHLYYQIITWSLSHDLLETIEEWEALLMLMLTWAFVKKIRRLMTKIIISQRIRWIRPEYCRNSTRI